MFLRLTILVLLTCLGARGATLVCTNLLLTHVQATVNAAANGDTVILPAGTNTWTAALNLNKAITLSGQGTNATRIIGNVLGGSMVNIEPSTDALVRITGITFDNLRNSSGATTLSIGGGVTQLRIDHCLFYKGMRTIYVDNQGATEPVLSYGVIDHCTFYNPQIAFGIAGDALEAWERPLDAGTTNALYVEDCYVLLDDNIETGSGLEPQQPIYTDHGARLAIRNCTFDASAPIYHMGSLFHSFGHVNIEGTLSGSVNDSGTRLFECYTNTFKTYQAYRTMFIRGGINLIHNNTYLDPAMVDYATRYVFTEYMAWYAYNVCTVWPCKHQIQNTFVWGNTVNGDSDNAVRTLGDENPASYGRDLTFIVENRDYWLVPPGVTNGSPVGTLSNYSPLIYPHPLVTLLDDPTNQAPSIATPPASRTVVAGSNVLFSVTAAGTAPLAYQWRFEGADVTDQTNQTYTVTNAQPDDAGDYAVVVTNGYGSVTSATAVLTVQTNPLFGSCVPNGASVAISDVPSGSYSESSFCITNYGAGILTGAVTIATQYISGSFVLTNTMTNAMSFRLASMVKTNAVIRYSPHTNSEYAVVVTSATGFPSQTNQVNGTMAAAPSQSLTLLVTATTPELIGSGGVRTLLPPPGGWDGTNQVYQDPSINTLPDSISSLKARWSFTVATAGMYYVKAEVNCEQFDEQSFYVNISESQTYPPQVSHVWNAPRYYGGSRDTTIYPGAWKTYAVSRNNSDNLEYPASGGAPTTWLLYPGLVNYIRFHGKDHWAGLGSVTIVYTNIAIPGPPSIPLTWSPTNVSSETTVPVSTADRNYAAP